MLLSLVKQEYEEEKSVILPMMTNNENEKTGARISVLKRRHLDYARRQQSFSVLFSLSS
ncbi:23805_t:CDS:2 [Entrophospora sp. SA101]|nr:14568_t:CDS:2 [Entrophospora sp. SA101]CAJ0745766.1 1684_t:CDS:2 [Entrophospora sp. SA101]CAJ0748394.1 23805_t:CDS:2 [Entrophospora sp. SA101]CAJ0873480.1 1177_t:CDS:2 [Entrophospora sp. SA101]CAJ0883429.1 4079_t:CDS:2 [Entrophospora sp. SA101]